MDSISATHRNRLMGLLADGVGGLGEFMEHPHGLAPISMVSQMLGLKPVARTLNELSYGGALGTGSGMTWRPKADTVDAAMTLAPLVAAAPAVINRGAAAVGKAMEPGVARLVDKIMSKGGRGAELLTDMASGTKSPATVWHGSPHKFDKFDASKIGTGEGAQAYGHGLYLAENKGVADEYATKLSKSIVDFTNRPINPVEVSIQQKLQSLADRTQSGSKLDEINKVFDSYLSPSLTTWNPRHPQANSYNGMAPIDGEKLARVMALRDAAKRLGRPDLGDSGSLYKVDLPDEHIAKMLDWDKPLSQQHPDVQAAFQSPEVQSMVQSLKQKGVMGDYSADELAKFKGEDWHDFIRQASSDSNVAPSEFLKQRGIPGIRYLDGGSRGTGAGTSNFVVFPGNEDILKIMERNGKGLLAD